MLKPFLVAILLAFFASFLNAQPNNYPKDYFRSPLNVPLYLAGNFGEIRSNHFHAGIDIKTQQREGLNVYAAAEGYVSRISISLYGYGKSLYIVHPNGYTTVYAHLQRFSPEIEEFVRQQQYNKKKFTLNLFPKKGELLVSKGDTIAISGNTGGSGGPHLHFEIRDSRNSVPINPLLFGFKIKDDIKPILKHLSIYPLNDTSTINGKNEPLHLKLYGSAGKYRFAKTVNLRARGIIGTGIETIDRLNGSNNRCGVYSIKLSADGKIVYQHEMEKIPFHLSRYINSHVDYYETRKNKRRVQKSFLDPNNQLNIYTELNTGGKLYFSKYGHDLNYEVYDSYGNTSQIDFKIALDSIPFFPEEKNDSTQTFQFAHENYFETDSLKVTIKSNSLYRDLPLKWRKGKRIAKSFAPTFEIMDRYTPLHKKAEIKIKIDSVSTDLKNKLYAVSLNEKNKVSSAPGGKVKGGWVTFKTKNFGVYTVLLDTIPPSIKKHNFKGNGKTFSTMKNISFKIKDHESGIKSFNGYIDNEWVLMEFDKKKSKLWYEFDAKRLTRGKHKLKVVITDNVGNSQSLTIDFIW